MKRSQLQILYTLFLTHTLLLMFCLSAQLGCDDESADTSELIEEVAPNALDYQGSWDMRIRLVDVGDIEVDFVLDITASEGQLDLVEVKSQSGGMVSEVIATVMNVPVDEEGEFELQVNEAAIPADYSPTGSSVVVSFTLTSRSSGFGFCGEVTGDVVTLMLPIAMSTFGAVKSGTSATLFGSCDDESGPAMLPRIEECPALTAGMNVINSADYDRAFEVILPSQYTAEESWPLVTLWHGFGSDPATIKANTQFESFVDEQGFILVIPTSYPGGAVEWDSLAATDSPDLAFFDDLTQCLGEAFSVDENRVHVTGMSGGGLWTAYLTTFRSEVIASSVGMSSGLIPDYPEGVTPIPYLAAWGGETDVAYDQDFHILAQDLLIDFAADDRFLMACNHGQEHEWLPEFTPWVLRFLLDHPRGIGERPYAGGLPEGVYPDYCEVVTAE